MTEKYQPIPHRLKNMAVGGHVAGAEDIDAGNGKTQQDINADTYRKNETYSKEQLNNMITTPEQEYLSVTATSETTDVDDIATLIATKYPDGKESADTVYRVGCWDGEQYNTNTYAEYVWDGTQYIPVGVKNPGIDNEPLFGSSNLTNSNGVKKGILESLRGYTILKNYTENYSEGEHNIVPSTGRDILIVNVYGLDGAIVVGGFSNDSENHIRCSFWDTYDETLWNNDHYISYVPYVENVPIYIPIGAKICVIHLPRTEFPNENHSSITVKVVDDFFETESAPDIDTGVVIQPSNIIEDASILISGIIRTDVANHYVYEYSIVGGTSNYSISFTKTKDDTYIGTVFYYDADDNCVGREIRSRKDKDLHINDYVLTIPPTAVMVRVNIELRFRYSLVLKNVGLLWRDTKQNLLHLKKDSFDNCVQIINESDILFHDGYIDTNGEVQTGNYSQYSVPIKIYKGDIVHIVSAGTDFAFISQTDSEATEYTPLLGYGDMFKDYVADEDGYVCLSGRKDMKVSIIRMEPSIKELCKKDTIEPIVLSGKWIDILGNITTSSSGNWDVYEYDVIQKATYLVSGGMLKNSTSLFVYFYDSEDNYIGHYLQGCSSKRFDWKDVFVPVPLNAVKIRINAYKSFPVMLRKARITEIQQSNGSTTTRTLPDYYDNYINERTNKVLHALLYSDPKTTSFCFATDLHYPINPNLGNIAAYILGNTPITSFICGGDIPNKADNFGEGTLPIDALYETIRLYNKDMTTIRNTGKPVLSVRGNHDFAINQAGSSGNDTNAVYIDWKAAANIIMNNIEGVVTNTSDDKACYFYLDYPRTQTRYIFIDTTDSNGNDGTNSKIPAVSNTQLEWIINEALLGCPQIYNIVLVSHQYIQRFLGTNYKYSRYTNFSNLKKLFDAVQNKKSVTINNIVYDFSDFTPNILFHISGHNHRDNAVYMNGYWSFTCAANYKSDEITKSYLYQKFPLVTKNVENGEGTIYENLVDTIIVNGTKDIQDIRCGAGYDRTFNREEVSCSVGDDVQITTNLDAEDIQWWCHDSNDKDNEEATTGAIEYANNYATIDSLGKLTAIESGYVTVVAYSETLNAVEYIGVKVS